MDEKKLIERIADRQGLQKDVVRNVLAGFKETTKDVVHAGGYVTLDGFGTFKWTKRQPDGDPPGGHIRQPAFFTSGDFKNRMLVPFEEFKKRQAHEKLQRQARRDAARTARRERMAKGSNPPASRWPGSRKQRVLVVLAIAAAMSALVLVLKSA